MAIIIIVIIIIIILPAFSVPVTKSQGVSGVKSFSVSDVPAGSARRESEWPRCGSALVGLRVRGGAGFQRLWLLHRAESRALLQTGWFQPLRDPLSQENDLQRLRTRTEQPGT